MTRRERHFGRFYSSIGLVTAENNFVVEDFGNKRTQSTPPRPLGNGWNSRLWDSMYGATSEEHTRESVLKRNAMEALKHGSTLAKLTRTLKLLLTNNAEDYSRTFVTVKKVDVAEEKTTTESLEFSSKMPMMIPVRSERRGGRNRSSRALRTGKAAKLKVAPMCQETAAVINKANPQATCINTATNPGSTSQRAKALGYKAVARRFSRRIGGTRIPTRYS